jgi:hypothetical protein
MLHRRARRNANAGKKENPRDAEKEEMWRAQQELLEARRTGRTLEDASKRRQKVSVSCGRSGLCRGDEGRGTC